MNVDPKDVGRMVHGDPTAAREILSGDDETIVVDGAAPQSRPYAPVAGGTIEHTMAEISLDLEETADRSAQLARRERGVRRRMQEAKRDKQMQAARLQLAGGALQAGAQAASAAVGVAGVQTGNKDLAGGYAKGAEAEGQMLSSTLGFFAKRAEIEASARETAATEAGERADDARSGEDRLRGFADKAHQHLDAVSRATHEARMAAIKG